MEIQCFVKMILVSCIVYLKDCHFILSVPQITMTDVDDCFYIFIRWKNNTLYRSMNILFHVVQNAFLLSLFFHETILGCEVRKNISIYLARRAIWRSRRVMIAGRSIEIRPSIPLEWLWCTNKFGVLHSAFKWSLI